MNVNIKKIDIRDVKLLYKWVNAEDSLTNKIITKYKIDVKSHVKWVRRYLTSGNKNSIWIILLNNKRVGQLRMDVKSNEKVFITDIFLEAKFRGSGIANIAYQKLIVEMKKKYFDYEIIANIKKKNKNSQSFFKRLGFKFIKEERNFYVFKKFL